MRWLIAYCKELKYEIEFLQYVLMVLILKNLMTKMHSIASILN